MDTMHTTAVRKQDANKLFSLENEMFDVLDKIRAGTRTDADLERLTELDSVRRDALKTLREAGFIW